MVTADTIIEIRLIWVFVIIGLIAFIAGFFTRDLEFLIDEIVFDLRRKRFERKNKSLT